MNKKQITELIKVNLRYANPQVTDKARKSGKSGAKLTRYILMQYLLSGGLFLVVYGFLMSMLNFNEMPGFFTYYVALFGIIAFSQGVSTIYNVFFESQDLPAYLPLPFKQNEIFIAKILVVAMTVIPFILPILAVFILAGIQARVFLGLAVILALILFFLFVALIFSLCSFIVFGLTRTAFFKKHKQTVTSLLLVFSTGIAVVGILMMNRQSGNIESMGLDRSSILPFLPFHYAVTSPFSTRGIMSILGLVVLTVGMLYLMKRILLPKLYEQLLDASSKSSSIKRKRKSNQNLWQQLFRYNAQLIKDPNLIMQVFSNSVLMPVIFILTFGITNRLNLSFLDIRYLGVAFFVGVVFSTLSVNPMSFAGNIISLDKENFLYILSLPLSMKQYLKEKLLFVYMIQGMINGFIIIATGLFFRVPILHLLSLIVGTLVGTYLFTQRYFVRDYRLLNLYWINISQLFTRGAGNWGIAFMMMGLIFGGGIILVLYGLGVTRYSYIIDIPVFLTFIVLAVQWQLYYQKNFWEKID